MADKMFRSPDERTGPAITGGEPIVLPEQRKNIARKVKQKKRELMD